MGALPLVKDGIGMGLVWGKTEDIGLVDGGIGTGLIKDRIGNGLVR